MAHAANNVQRDLAYQILLFLCGCGNRNENRNLCDPWRHMMLVFCLTEMNQSQSVYFCHECMALVYGS